MPEPGRKIDEGISSSVRPRVLPNSDQAFSSKERVKLWDILCLTRVTTSVELAERTGHSEAYVLNQLRKLKDYGMVNYDIMPAPSREFVAKSGAIPRYIWFPVNRPIAKVSTSPGLPLRQVHITDVLDVCELIFGIRSEYSQKVYSILVNESGTDHTMSLSRLAALAKLPPYITMKIVSTFARGTIVSYSFSNTECPKCIKEGMEPTKGDVVAKDGIVTFHCSRHGDFIITHQAATKLRGKEDVIIRLMRIMQMSTEPLTPPISREEIEEKTRVLREEYYTLP